MTEKLDEFIKNEGVILPKDFVVEVYAQVLKFAGGLAGLLQAGSKKAGVSAAKALSPYISEEEAASNLKEVVEEFFRKAGFGEIEVEVGDSEVVMNVKDSFLLKAHKKPEVALRPLAGAAEGFIGEVMGKKTKTKIDGTRIVINLG